MSKSSDSRWVPWSGLRPEDCSQGQVVEWRSGNDRGTLTFGERIDAPQPLGLPRIEVHLPPIGEVLIPPNAGSVYSPGPGGNFHTFVPLDER